MAKKQYKIRWRDSDTAELERTIKNFNAKLYRLKKTKPELADYLPDRVSKTEVMKSIGTRADYNRVIHSLQRFSRKGAEKPIKSSRGAKATKWEVNEMKIKARSVNRKRKIEREKLLDLEVKTRGEGTGVKRSQMGTLKENSLKPIEVNFENKSQKEWDLKRRAIDSQLDSVFSAFRKSNMKLNYIKGLENAGFSTDIIAMVHQMDVDEFIATVESDEQATFEFIYDPIEFYNKQAALYATWEQALKNQEAKKQQS